MQIQIEELKRNDVDQVTQLIESMYLELGEDACRVNRFAEKFVNQLYKNQNGVVLVVRTFITNELVKLVTLTPSKAIYGCGRYGVLDELYSEAKFRSQLNDVDLKDEIKEIALRKDWGRIDVAAPTDAWYRTVRFYRNQQLRLTTPKFRYVLELAGAA